MLALVMASTLWAQNAQTGGYGTVKPYELKVSALKGPETTDVFLTVTTQPGYAVPQKADKVLLKSIDTTTGEAQWAKNTFNVPLTDGQVSYAFGDIIRHMPVEAQVNVKTDQSVNAEVLKASTVALLRPDLTIHAVNAPSSVRPKQPVNIEVVVQELNQDLGATFDVCLYEGDAKLDEAVGLSIDPAGLASVVFTVSFEQTGTHTLTAVVKNVSPGEYDASNNSKTFTIDVTSTNPAWYWLSYYDYEFDYSYAYSGWWGSQVWQSKGLQESFYYSTYSNQPVNWPIDNVTVQFYADGALVTDGSINNLSPLWSWNDGNWSYAYTWQYLNDQNAYVYLYTYTWNNNTWTYLAAQRWAADVVYFSSGYYDYWWSGVQYTGSWSYTYQYTWGSFVHARDQVKSYVVLTDDGTSTGGWGQTGTIQPFEWSGSWSYSDPNSNAWWDSSYWYKGWSGWGYGQTTP